MAKEGPERFWPKGIDMGNLFPLALFIVAASALAMTIFLALVVFDSRYIAEFYHLNAQVSLNLGLYITDDQLLLVSMGHLA